MTHLAEKFSTHYLNVADYANRIGISRQAVYKAIHKGRLKAVKVGRNFYVQRGINAQ